MFWLITILWIGIILYLSSQNGVQTTQLSSGLSRKIAGFLYRHPTVGQVHQVHMLVRKSAHVILFFILGMLAMITGSLTFHRGTLKGRLGGLVLSLVITCGYAFIDEWHKQFIVGRHFDIEEMVLNLYCGIAGIVIAALAVKLFRKRQGKV